MTEEILNYTNNINKHLRFKITYEKNGKINVLYLLITRNEEKITIDIFRKPTNTDITTHYNSNHHREHKLAAFAFPLNRTNHLFHNQAKSKKLLLYFKSSATTAIKFI